MGWLWLIRVISNLQKAWRNHIGKADNRWYLGDKCSFKKNCFKGRFLHKLVPNVNLKLILIFSDPHRIDRSFPLATAGVLQYLVMLASKRMLASKPCRLMNILMATIRSSRIRHHYSLSSKGRWRRKLPTVWPIFQCCPNGKHISRGLANRFSYHRYTSASWNENQFWKIFGDQSLFFTRRVSALRRGREFTVRMVHLTCFSRVSNW